MNNTSDKKQLVERILQTEYEKKGFLLEDDIIDICIEHDLDLVEIDNLCDKLLNLKMIVKDVENKRDVNDSESYVDRSHLDYDELLGEIKREYPNCATVIDEILEILPPQSKEWQMLMPEAKNGNIYAKDRLLLMYLRTVMKQAYYFSKDNYCDFEEAFQNGVIGLMNAIEKYDVTSSDLFSSYFPLWVRQNMQRDASIRGTILRYPAHYKDQLNVIVADVSNIIENDDFEEALMLLTEHAKVQSGLSHEEIVKYVYPYVEIPEELESEGEIEALEKRTFNEHLDRVFSLLNERERYVLELRFGLIDNQERTLEDVGKILSVTRERVRQIESKALRKIRAAKETRYFKDYL